MKTLLSTTLLSVFALLQINTFSQITVLDSVQIRRVAKTSQLWGHLKYFHPYLSENTIDWEGAFANSIEAVIRTKSQHEFGNAVQQMLDQLSDPATRVVMKSATHAAEDTIRYPVISFVRDSMLLVSVRDYRDLEDINYARAQFGLLTEKIPLSKGIIFDLRSAHELGDVRGYLSWYFSNIEGNLCTEELSFPGLKTRFHDGFVPETGGTSGGYYSGFYTKGETKITPAPTAVDRPVVFVVNKYAEIPMIALALQMANKAKIISTDPLTDASIVDVFNYPLDDSLEVTVRLNALPPGIAMKADYIIPTHTTETELLQMAWQLSKGQKIAATTEPHSESNATTVKTMEKKPDVVYPDLGHRLLAAAKIWTVIDYFFAYRDLMHEGWDEVLKEYLPRFASAADSLQYHLTVAEMYRHIQDGHGFIRSNVLNGYFGIAIPPLVIRFIEEQPVVTGIFPDSIHAVRGIDVGDIILAVDGESTVDRVKRMSDYISASNSSALLNYISWRFLNGSDGSNVDLKIQKEDGSIGMVTLPRTNAFSEYSDLLGNGRNLTPVTRMINKDIAYADLDRLTNEMVDEMFVDFKDAKAIIFDMRGYPNGTARSIAPHLTDREEVYGASFRRYSPMGIKVNRMKHMTFFDQSLPKPRLPYYQGKTVMLIDERTQSQAEHTGLFFEAANGTTFIGSQTAGANGDVTNFQIPGNITLFFSGHDVRHADGRQLQQVGLVPDVFVKPTINGIRENRDEVLQKAIEFLENQTK